MTGVGNLAEPNERREEIFQALVPALADAVRKAGPRFDRERLAQLLIGLWGQPESWRFTEHDIADELAFMESMGLVRLRRKLFGQGAITGLVVHQRLLDVHRDWQSTQGDSSS